MIFLFPRWDMLILWRVPVSLVDSSMTSPPLWQGEIRWLREFPIRLGLDIRDESSHLIIQGSLNGMYFFFGGISKLDAKMSGTSNCLMEFSRKSFCAGFGLMSYFMTLTSYIEVFFLFFLIWESNLGNFFRWNTPKYTKDKPRVGCSLFFKVTMPPMLLEPKKTIYK